MAQPKFGAKPTGWEPPKKGPLVIFLIILLCALTILLLLISLKLWPFNSAVERTNDAYVRGLSTVISPQVSGYAQEILVDDFDYVRKGQVLVRIEDGTYRAKVSQAEANLATQEANLAGVAQQIESARASIISSEASVTSAAATLDRSEADYRRARALLPDGSVSRQEYDQTWNSLRTSRSDLVTAEANLRISEENLRAAFVRREGLIASVQMAKAQLQQARIDLGYTVIRAPGNGQVNQISVKRGAYVSAGTQLFYLVPPEVWVIANYKEGQTRGMRVGAPVTFAVDALGGQIFRGWIQSISPATGSEFSVSKPDNATGNFVKVAQRVSVRIAIYPNQPHVGQLRPGLSVETAVDTAAPVTAR